MLENISIEEMYYEDFIRLMEVPMQRNTEERLKTAKHLRVLRPEHCIVHLVRLIKDCKVKGKLYRKGTLMRVDSNTRAMTWEEGKSDSIPEKVFAIIYDWETMDEVKECYNCFDSSEATEKNQQKLYGIITGMYNYQPKSQRLTQGIILSGLNKACHFMYPDLGIRVLSKHRILRVWLVLGLLMELFKHWMKSWQRQIQRVGINHLLRQH